MENTGAKRIVITLIACVGFLVTSQGAFAHGNADDHVRDPGMMGGQYGPGMMGGQYGHGMMGGQYGHGMMGGQYGPGMMGGQYGPGMMGGQYGPGMMGGQYGPGMMGGQYGPGMMGGQYGPGMMGGQYGPGMMGGQYGPGMMGGQYGPGMMGGDFGHHMMDGQFGLGMMADFDKLDISDEQRSAIFEAQDNLQKKHWEIAGLMLEQQSKLRDVLSADRPEASAVGAVFGRIFDLRRQMIEAGIEHRNAVSDLLNDEQVETLRRRARQAVHRGPGGRISKEGAAKGAGMMHDRGN